MTAPVSARLDAAMPQARALAPLLDSVCAAVVAGGDPQEAAAVAVALAQLQGARRRVAIADLVGDSPILTALADSDDPHGISDSFLYGVSLNRIAHPMAGADSVFLMQSGTGAVTDASIYASDRWRRLAAGFHQVDALLLVVAVPGTTGFAELCAHIGALIPIDIPLSAPDGVQLIGVPSGAPSRTITPDMRAAEAVGQTSSPAPDKLAAAHARAVATESTDGRRRNLMAGVFVLCAIGVALGATWPWVRAHLPPALTAWMAAPAADTAALLVKPTPMDTLHRADSALLDSAKRAADSVLTAATASRPASPPPTVVNASDSAMAAQYAVFFTAANTRKDALSDSHLQKQATLAVAPVAIDGATWYRVYLGANLQRAGADSLLTRLRKAKVVTGGTIATVPFAFRLERDVAASAVPARLTEYGARGVLAYALRQPDGTTMLFTGAFETPAQATILADSLKTMGILPVLAYRTGRSF